MLANPISFPAYADPTLWALALLAIWAEVLTGAWLLGRAGRPGLRDFAGRWFVANLATWFAFLFALDRAGRALHDDDLPLAVTALEAAVVLVETLLLRTAARRGWLPRERLHHGHLARGAGRRVRRQRRVGGPEPGGARRPRLVAAVVASGR